MSGVAGRGRSPTKQVCFAGLFFAVRNPAKVSGGRFGMAEKFLKGGNPEVIRRDLCLFLYGSVWETQIYLCAGLTDAPGKRG